MDDIALSLQEITANSKKLPNFLFSSILWKQKTNKKNQTKNPQKQQQQKNRPEEPTNQKTKQTKTTKTKQTKKICVPAHGYDTYSKFFLYSLRTGSKSLRLWTT